MGWVSWVGLCRTKIWRTSSVAATKTPVTELNRYTDALPVNTRGPAPIWRTSLLGALNTPLTALIRYTGHMSQRTCPTCGSPLGVGGDRGRAPTYCSGRCRTAGHRSAGVPAAMRQRPRWVGWSRRDPEPRPHWIPNFWFTEKDMSDPGNWVGWEQAQDHHAERGFILGDGVGYLTIAGCVSPDGVVDHAVLTWLREFDSFAEITWYSTAVQVVVLTPEAPQLDLSVAGHSAVLVSTPDHWIPLTGHRIGRAQVARQWVGTTSVELS